MTQEQKLHYWQNMRTAMEAVGQTSVLSSSISGWMAVLAF